MRKLFRNTKQRASAACVTCARALGLIIHSSCQGARLSMLLYRILITLAAPILAIVLFVRVLRKQESLSDFAERLGFWKATPKEKTIWVHGASNGEMASAKGLIEGLLSQNPSAQLLLSCNSISAKQMMIGWQLPNVHVRLAPLDFGWVYRRLLRRHEVSQFILLEGDFWPNRMRAVRTLDVPSALIAGRISAKSAATWQKFPSLIDEVLKSFDLVCPQDSASKERLGQLGVTSHAFGPEISLKSLYQGENVAQDREKRAEFWLAASTHEGEDEIILQAQKDLKSRGATVRLILAPRHPKRADHIAGIARSFGLSLTQRSKGASLEEHSDVYLADTLGEMEKWYQSAATCFVAGSLVAKGGHTPFEPHRFDCAILHGPHYENFTDAYVALQCAHGSRLCKTSSEIANAVIDLRDASTAQTQCQNARKALEKTQSLEAVLDALCQISKT